MWVTLYKSSQCLTSMAQIRALNMSVPSQDYYIINRVEEIKNVSLSKNFSKYYER